MRVMPIGWRTGLGAMALRPLQPRRIDRQGVASARPITPLLVRCAVSGFLATTVIVLGAAFGGGKFASHLPGAWFFGTPGGPGGSLSDSGDPSLASIIGVYGGLALLACTWVTLLRALWRHPGVPVRQVVLVLSVWAIPLLLGPPLFSPDVYSYAGQGELVSYHINPYSYGTGVLGATPFNILAGKVWAQSPSPYGPVFLGLDGLMTIISGHHLLTDLVLLRFLALVGVVLAMAGLPTLARAAGRDPAAVMVLGIGSPLVLVTLLAGSHNDALMVGLLVAGLAVARRFGPVPGIVLCALAAAVKSPALLGVVFIGWNWPGPLAATKARLMRTALALGLAVVTLAVVSAITGLGWGWVHTQTGETAAVTGVTPVYAVAHVLAGLASVVGLHGTLSAMRVVTTVIGLLVAAGATFWLLRRSPELGMVQALGLSLLVLALLSPILWAWYCSWGLMVLASTAGGRLRRVLMVIAIGEAFIGASSLKFMSGVLWRKGILEDLLVVLVVAAVFLVWHHFEVRREATLEPLGDEDVAVEELALENLAVEDRALEDGDLEDRAGEPGYTVVPEPVSLEQVAQRAAQPLGLTLTANQLPQPEQ